MTGLRCSRAVVRLHTDPMCACWLPRPFSAPVAARRAEPPGSLEELVNDIRRMQALIDSVAQLQRPPSARPTLLPKPAEQSADDLEATILSHEGDRAGLMELATAKLAELFTALGPSLPGCSSSSQIGLLLSEQQANSGLGPNSSSGSDAGQVKASRSDFAAILRGAYQLRQAGASLASQGAELAHLRSQLGASEQGRPGPGGSPLGPRAPSHRMTRTPSMTSGRDDGAAEAPGGGDAATLRLQLTATARLLQETLGKKEALEGQLSHAEAQVRGAAGRHWKRRAAGRMWPRVVLSLLHPSCCSAPPTCRLHQVPVGGAPVAHADPAFPPFMR